MFNSKNFLILPSFIFLILSFFFKENIIIQSIISILISTYFLYQYKNFNNNNNIDFLSPIILNTLVFLLGFALRPIALEIFNN